MSNETSVCSYKVCWNEMMMVTVYLLCLSTAKLATEITPRHFTCNLFAVSVSLWQTEHPIHLYMSTPSCQRCLTMSHPPRRMESRWARSRTTTTAVSSSPPRRFPKVCRTRVLSGSLTTQTRSHDQGKNQPILNVNPSHTKFAQNMNSSLCSFEGRISLYCLALQDIQQHCSQLQEEKYMVSIILFLILQ